MAYDLFGLDKKRRGMGQQTPSRVPVGFVRFQGQGPGYGRTNLWGMGGPITRDQATSAARNPLWNVQSATQQTQPYPDRILTGAAEAQGKFGIDAYNLAKQQVGEPITITNFSKSLDRDFIAAAGGSMMPEEDDGENGYMSDVSTGGQPRPGDFGMEFSMFGDRKKKKRGLFG